MYVCMYVYILCVYIYVYICVFIICVYILCITVQKELYRRNLTYTLHPTP